MIDYKKKICSLPELQDRCTKITYSGQKTVFTNGCFDILHPGHIRYLTAARQLGDHLIVAVNSDKSVKFIKGAKRPILPQDARAELLAALICVDSVIIFEQKTPFQLIKTIIPDVLVKGGDWSIDEIIGSDVVQKAGGLVKSITFEPGFSTTSIIEKILNK